MSDFAASFVAQLVVLGVALIAFIVINRRITSRVLRRRTKELLREFRTNISTMEKKLQSAMTSREEIALEIDRRMLALERSATSTPAPENRTSDSWQRLRTEMPKLEDKIKEHAGKEKDLVKEINALEREYINVKEMAGTLDPGEGQANLMTALETFHETVAQALYTSERFVGECGETLNEVLTNISPMFHLCDCCGASGDSIFVCLNCSHRYCENCKGVRIGHCLKCAPNHKAISLDIH